MVDATPKHPELSQEDLETLRKKVVKKMGDVSKTLEKVLAGQDVRLEDLPLPGEPDPEWTKIQRLRHYLKLLKGARDRIFDGSIGFCLVGGEPIPKLQLMEMPWAETCQEHAGQDIVAK